jgi:CheY-like chemotaxis protein
MPGTRVLVVDDDVSFIRRATVSLGTVADVEFLHSGDDLLRCVYHWLPDIVLLNMLLDDRDGFLMLEELLELDLDHPPFVLCTTSGPLSATRLSDCPDWPVGTIPRTARLEQLRDTVESVLAGREDAEETPDEVPVEVRLPTAAG